MRRRSTRPPRNEATPTRIHTGAPPDRRMVRRGSVFSTVSAGSSGPLRNRTGQRYCCCPVRLLRGGGEPPRRVPASRQTLRSRARACGVSPPAPGASRSHFHPLGKDHPARVSRCTSSGGKSVTSIVERMDGSPDRASGDRDRLLPCASANIRRSASLPKKRGWPPAALPPLSRSRHPTPARASSTSPPCPSASMLRASPRGGAEETARENSADSADSDTSRTRERRAS
jgi:hypothetical protein